MARVDNLTNFLTDVASAIKTKKGDNTDIPASNFDTEIANLPSGGGDPTEEKKVFLYTPYGDLAYSYSVNEFNELSEMPAGVPIEGLTFQEWNWTLAEIKSYLATTGGFEVHAGGTYTASDGKSKFYFRLEVPETITFTIYEITGTPTIDWGDGTTETISASGTLTHEYQTTGDMVISIDGTIAIGQNFFNGQSQRLRKAILANIAVRTSLFNTSSVEYLVLSKTVAPYDGNNSNISGFIQGALLLKSLVLPRSISEVSPNFAYGNTVIEKLITSGVTTRIYQNTFYGTSNLRYMTLPISCVANQSFQYAGIAVKELAFSNSDTTSNYSVANLTGLKKVYFKSTSNPANLISTFYNDNNLEEITLIGADSITSLTGTFSGCQQLKKITIPAGVKTLGQYTFSNCRSLKSLELPAGLTSISSACFQSCSSLSYLKIPKGVPTIMANAFSGSGLQVIDFSDHESVPTLSNTNAFDGLINASTYEIRVPSALYNDWVAATNWSNSTIVSHIVAV